MSYTRGVSFHHETNASSNPNITNSITINASNELSQSNTSVIIDPESKPDQQIQTDPVTILNENEFLKKVLEIYMNQKLYWSNKYLILTSDELLDLIQTLLPDKGIVITSNDIEDLGCCGFVKDSPIKKVESIWISDGDAQQNFKYCFSNLVALLDQYHISIKFVRV